jgi:hypothetical protein
VNHGAAGGHRAKPESDKGDQPGSLCFSSRGFDPIETPPVFNHELRAASAFPYHHHSL